MAKQITKTEMSGHMFMLCLWIPQSSTITNINMVFARIISHHTKDPAGIRKERWMDELASKVCNGTRKSWQNNLDIEANPFTMTTEKYSYAVSSHACREVRITHLLGKGGDSPQASFPLPPILSLQDWIEIDNKQFTNAKIVKGRTLSNILLILLVWKTLITKS